MKNIIAFYTAMGTLAVLASFELTFLTGILFVLIICIMYAAMHNMTREQVYEVTGAAFLNKTFHTNDFTEE